MWQDANILKDHVASIFKVKWMGTGCIVADTLSWPVEPSVGSWPDLTYTGETVASHTVTSFLKERGIKQG